MKYYNNISYCDGRSNRNNSPTYARLGINILINFKCQYFQMMLGNARNESVEVLRGGGSYPEMFVMYRYYMNNLSVYVL